MYKTQENIRNNTNKEKGRNQGVRKSLNSSMMPWNATVVPDTTDEARSSRRRVANSRMRAASRGRKPPGLVSRVGNGRKMMLFSTPKKYRAMRKSITHIMDSAKRFRAWPATYCCNDLVSDTPANRQERPGGIDVRESCFIKAYRSASSSVMGTALQSVVTRIP